MKPRAFLACPIGVACACLIAFAPGCARGRAGVRHPADDRLGQSQELAARAWRAQERGHAPEAIELYRQALALNRDHWPSWNNLGLLLMQQENYLDAVEAFKIASDLAPGVAEPARNAGVAYLRRGWADEALRYFEMALERSPRDIESLRGAIEAADRLGASDQKQLDRLRRASLAETDPHWRERYEFKRLQVEAAIRARHDAEIEALDSH